MFCRKLPGNRLPSFNNHHFREELADVGGAVTCPQTDEYAVLASFCLGRHFKLHFGIGDNPDIDCIF
jgi:hypothetical protein